MPPLTQEQFQKARASGFTTEQIIGFEKKRLSETAIEETPKPKDQFLPGRERVEELRGKRSAITTEPFERFASPKKLSELLYNPMARVPEAIMGIGEVSRTIESGISSAGLKAQEGAGGRDIIKAFYGSDVTERPAEFGDIPRSAGVPEPLSKAIGLGTAMAVPDLVSLGQLKYGKNIIADSKAVIKGTKATGKFLAKPVKPFKSLKALGGPGQRELGEEISEITTQAGTAEKKEQILLMGVKEGFQYEKEIQKGRLELANNAFKENKLNLMNQLTDDAERGTLNARERLPDWYKANTQTYKAGLDEVANKGGDFTLEEARGILLDTIDESETSFLRGQPLVNIKKLLNTKYGLPKEAEEGAEGIFELTKEKGKSLIGWVKKSGGIDPEKTKLAGYNISEDFKQSGINSALRKGGRSIDDIAKSAQEAGVIPTLPNENPSYTLMRLLKEKHSYGEIDTSKFGKMGARGGKTFDMRDVKADIDEIADSIEYGKRSSSEAIPAYILRKKFGDAVVTKVPEFADLQASYSQTIETMKWADRYFKPFADPLASKQGVNLLKRFGLGKSQLGEETFIRKLEKQGIGDITSPVSETGKSLKLIDEDIAKTRTNITTLLETKEISSKSEITKIQNELEKRLDDLGQLKKVAQIKLQNRRQAERLLWYLGIGLAGATQFGKTGRTIRGIGAFGMAGD